MDSQPHRTTPTRWGQTQALKVRRTSSRALKMSLVTGNEQFYHVIFNASKRYTYMIFKKSRLFVRGEGHTAAAMVGVLDQPHGFLLGCKLRRNYDRSVSRN
jgi:hypothetical protein